MTHMYELKIIFDSIDQLYEFVNAYKNKEQIVEKKTVTLPPSDEVDGMHPGKDKGYYGKSWTSYDDQFIKDHYKSMKYSEIAKKLGRTTVALNGHIALLIKEGKIEKKNCGTYKIKIPKNTTIHYASDGVHIS